MIGGNPGTMDVIRMDNCNRMQRACRILRGLGLSVSSMESVESHSNDVWMTQDHVLHYHVVGPVGRLEHEARVAARLLPEALYPEVVAVGRDGNHDWLVTKRVPGTTLSAVWPSLPDKERRRAIVEVAAALKAIHCSPAVDLVPPCLQRGVPVISRRVLADRLRELRVPPSFYSLLEADDRPHVMVHGDFNFNQALWRDGHITALFDLEMSHAETPDWDLGTFLEFCHNPARMVPEHLEAISNPRDYQEAPVWFREAYPEILVCAQMRDRLALYALVFRFEELHTNTSRLEKILDEVVAHACILADMLTK